MRLSLRALWAGLALWACDLRPPHAVLTIEDPEGVAAGAVAVRLGTDPEALAPRRLEERRFPLTITLTSRRAGVERLVWVEATDSEDRVLARGRTVVSFEERRAGTATIRLRPPCEIDGECERGSYCEGARRCEERVCSPPEDPCPPSPFECVQVRCVEGLRSCDVRVDHSRCVPAGEEPSYCDPAAGCVRGKPCQVDRDCQDGSTCNGAEQCVGFRCIAGIPPSVDDNNVCTVDACAEPDGAAHIPDLTRDGQACGDGICVYGKCATSTCGDGLVDPRAEQCEDGNANPNDGCDGCRRTSWSASLISGLGPGGGQPGQTALSYPSFAHVDRWGNVFVANTGQHRVLRMDARTGLVTTVAGTGIPGASGDGGPAFSAQLNSPYGVFADGQGNVLIADYGNHRIRRVAAATGLITTIAGTGTAGFSGDSGPATTAQLLLPSGVFADGQGNVLIADYGNQRIRRVATGTGVITTIAGTGTQGFSGDNGPATTAQINYPCGVFADGQGNVLIADYGNQRIRRVAAATGLITTIAGTGTQGFSGDNGPATSARLSMPTGVFADGQGNVLIAELGNHRIRQVAAATGLITTIAGTGTQGFSGDSGPATSARLSMPIGVSSDGQGNMFISDKHNHRVRRVAAATGIITTIVGTATPGSFGDNGPATSAQLDNPVSVFADPQGNVLIADSRNDRIRRLAAATGTISTIAGTGARGFSGDNGLATGAELSLPHGVFADGQGNVLIADTWNNRLRRVSATTGFISTIAGTGSPGFSGDNGPATSARLFNPNGVFADNQGNVLIADTNNHRIRRVAAATGVISTVAGTGVQGFSGDNGPATSAQLNYPVSVFADPQGNVLIADTNNHRVRRVAAATGVVSTVAGTGVQGFSGDNGPATSAQLNTPNGVFADSQGNIVIADSTSLRVRRVAATTGVITTIAGIGSPGFSGDNGPATSANLEYPYGVFADDQGNVLVADRGSNRIRRVAAASGVITTVAGAVDPPGDGTLSASVLGSPSALASMTANSWLVADGATGRVRALDFVTGTLRTVAGYAGGFSSEGTQARYSRQLKDAAGIAVDTAAMKAYVTERAGHTLRRLDLQASPWTISTLGGRLDEAGHQDGALSASRFSAPAGLAFHAATRKLYLADSGNHVIRAVDLAAGTVSTVAGVPRNRGYFGEGVPASQALLNAPEAVALGNDGSLYIADTGNQRVRRMDPAGRIETVIGDGTEASSGVGAPARLFPVDNPRGLAVDRYGNLFVSSRRSLRLVSAGPDGIATGEDEVQTIYGAPPRQDFPEPVTYCLSGMATLANGSGELDARLFLLDACQGMLIQLDRQRP